MISIPTLIFIFALHFIADFIMQSDYIAKNKSKSNKVLFTHVTIYALPFLLIGFWYAVTNAVLHFVVDFFTSRKTSKLWAEGEVHWFFVVIGFDQFLHISSLVITYWWLIL